MDNLSNESIEWSISHIRRYGDTDLLPVPFEYDAIKHSWSYLRNEIANIDLSSYECRPYRRFLVPKQFSGYRVAIQLDPIDAIIYTALAYEACNLIEKYRVPIERKVACSYRVEIGSKGELFKKNNGWDDFHNMSRELANSGKFGQIVIADIADFYNHIEHHRVRNALEYAGVNEDRAKNIENFLMNLTRGHSQAIPIGPAASIVFAEACLSDVDNFLLRKGYIHTRYVDDFRIFCKDINQANSVLHDLTEYLFTSHRLTLQTHKTRIYQVNEFIGNELIDPEELEKASTKEKINSTIDSLSYYSDFDEYFDEPDENEIIRENLVDMFKDSLKRNPLHLGLAKYLLRRATALRTGVLREIVLDNINNLIPVFREVVLYIIATTQDKYSQSIGNRFIEECKKTDYYFLRFVQIWITELFIKKMNNSMSEITTKLCEDFNSNLGCRQFALLAKQNKFVDWVREQKETWQNNTPWDRRAIIWASQALSNDEMKYWIQRVHNAGDILDKAIAEAALQIKNS